MRHFLERENCSSADFFATDLDVAMRDSFLGGVLTFAIQFTLPSKFIGTTITAVTIPDRCRRARARPDVPAQAELERGTLRS